MIGRNRRTYFLIFVLIFFVFGCAKAPVQPDVAKKLTVLHFNDMHGYLQEPPSSDGMRELGGLARLATRVQEIRQERAEAGVPTLLLFAGDIITGSKISSFFYGTAEVDVLNRLGVDAAAVGNHEFDYGLEQFDKIVASSNFPWLVSNLRGNNESTPWLPGAKLFHLPNGLTVRVIGATTPDLRTKTNPKNVKDLILENPVSAIRGSLHPQSRPPEINIVLSHCGMIVDKQIARAFGNLPLIVGGHNHYILNRPLTENSNLILQAGKNGEYLGCLDIEFQNNRYDVVGYKMIPITRDIPEDPEIKTLVQTYLNKVDEKYNVVIGESNSPMEAASANKGGGESVLGDFVCDLLRERLGADVFVINSGALRASLPKGPITVGDVMQAFPFSDKLVTMPVSGTAIRAALELGLKKDPEGNAGPLLQVSGLTYQIDGEKAVNIRIGGEPLDESRKYSLGVSDFIASGGDGFTMLTDIPGTIDTGLFLNDILIKTIRRKNQITAPAGGRITQSKPQSLSMLPGDFPTSHYLPPEERNAREPIRQLLAA